jgi:hypothetical protein
MAALRFLDAIDYSRMRIFNRHYLPFGLHVLLQTSLLRTRRRIFFRKRVDLVRRHPS